MASRGKMAPMVEKEPTAQQRYRVISFLMRPSVCCYKLLLLQSTKLAEQAKTVYLSSFKKRERKSFCTFTWQVRTSIAEIFFNSVSYIIGMFFPTMYSSTRYRTSVQPRRTLLSFKNTPFRSLQISRKLWLKLQIVTSKVSYIILKFLIMANDSKYSHSGP